jgi:hypothetical protein
MKLGAMPLFIIIWYDVALLNGRSSPFHLGVASRFWLPRPTHARTVGRVLVAQERRICQFGTTQSLDPHRPQRGGSAGLRSFNSWHMVPNEINEGVVPTGNSDRTRPDPT